MTIQERQQQQNDNFAEIGVALSAKIANYFSSMLEERQKLVIIPSAYSEDYDNASFEDKATLARVSILCFLEDINVLGNAAEYQEAFRLKAQEKGINL